MFVYFSLQYVFSFGKKENFGCFSEKEFSVRGSAVADRDVIESKIEAVRSHTLPTVWIFECVFITLFDRRRETWRRNIGRNQRWSVRCAREGNPVRGMDGVRWDVEMVTGAISDP